MDHIVDEAYIRAANARFDAEHHSVCMDDRTKMKSSWRSFGHIKGELTDRKIAKYEKAGFYSPEATLERRVLQAQKAARKRHGNFVESGGRFIYSPV
jgi:hypothetical protein